MGQFSMKIYASTGSLLSDNQQLVGVPLFVDEPSRLTSEQSRIDDKLALLPQSVRVPRSKVKDDF